MSCKIVGDAVISRYELLLDVLKDSGTAVPTSFQSASGQGERGDVGVDSTRNPLSCGLVEEASLMGNIPYPTTGGNQLPPATLSFRVGKATLFPHPQHLCSP